MLDRRRCPTVAAVLDNLSAMQLEPSSPVRSHQTEQPGLFVALELDLSVQHVVRQAHLELWTYSALVALSAVLDNVAHIWRQRKEPVLLALMVALAESAVPVMILAVVDSDYDFGDVEVVLSVAVPVDSDSTLAAAVVPVDSS